MNVFKNPVAPSNTSEPELQETGLGMFLIFRLEGQAFAVSVKNVNEILALQEPTPVPNAGPFAPGLINVRGVVVPVLDIRHRMRMAPASQLETARMIVFERIVGDSSTRLAFCADSVEEVFDTHSATLETIPRLGAVWPQEFLLGAVRHLDELVVLLDADCLFEPDTAHDAA